MSQNHKNWNITENKSSNPDFWEAYMVKQRLGEEKVFGPLTQSYPLAMDMILFPCISRGMQEHRHISTSGSRRL